MDSYPRLPSYRILSKLNVGAHATVYKAESLSGGVCALKVYKSHRRSGGHSGAEPPSHFFRELEVLSNTSHPNLVKLTDFGKTLGDRSDFLAFEWADGEDFLSASKRVSRLHFYSMIAQVCAGLDHLHRRGYVHGDLNPNNIWVTTGPGSTSLEPTVKILDFGYAMRNDASSSDIVMVSPHYIAPEIIKGTRCTCASDLYSLGVI